MPGKRGGKFLVISFEIVQQLTINLDKEWLNNVVSNELKVGVTDPVRNGGPRTGEEVIENGNFVTEQHQSVDQVGADETSTTSYC
jgi:hypothetical protein